MRVYERAHNKIYFKLQFTHLPSFVTQRVGGKGMVLHEQWASVCVQLHLRQRWQYRLLARPGSKRLNGR